MLGFEPKLSDSQSKNLGNILQEITENFGLHRSNVQCKQHMYILLYFTIVFLSSYSKAKTVLGMLYEVVVATSAMICKKGFALHTGARAIPPTLLDT